MKISKEGIDINKRFFSAIEMLKAQKVIRGLQTFTTAHEINRWNMLTVREKPETSVMKVEWLSYMVKDYGISAEWLLTGRGNMFS